MTLPPSPPRLPAALRDAVLAWYDARGRALPFRGTTDPYAVLVSEVMAQQTQIGRVGERWTAFLDRFPTLAALASATPADVLREWRGLGYNRRAIGLWRTARIVVAEHGGVLPGKVAILETLPGIGPYTARAVAAIAFGQPVGPVDTNVRRVLRRALVGNGELERSRLQEAADAAVPADRAADWTHAVMDVGATYCRARAPRCDDCPARPWCRYASSPPATPIPARARPVGRRFVSSTRWLRGRIVDSLTAGDTEWRRFDEPIGEHDVERVRSALRALAADGLIEHDVTGQRARLARS